jgi:hypothetical protein
MATNKKAFTKAIKYLDLRSINKVEASKAYIKYIKRTLPENSAYYKFFSSRDKRISAARARFTNSEYFQNQLEKKISIFVSKNKAIADGLASGKFRFGWSPQRTTGLIVDVASNEVKYKINRVGVAYSGKLGTKKEKG